VKVGATLIASLLAVLARPATWPLALLGFLVRGGWLLIVAPIVVVPTPVGLANIVAPLLEDVAFGRRTGEVMALVAVVVVVAIAWLVAGGLIAAVAEADGVRRIADEEGFPWHGGSVAWRIAGVRLVAHLPLAIGAAWAAVRIVSAAYRELTVPSDVTVPAAWRIVAGAPDAFAIVAVTWLAGEIVGALATRRIVLGGDGGRAALRAGVGRVREDPARVLTLGITGTAALVVVLATTGLAAGATWNALGAALSAGDASMATTLLLLVFVGLFGGGLVLIGLVCAWRAAIWTMVVGGTFGGGNDTRSGD
jgi:hypothetical protein